jgi:flagellar protein FliS
MPEEAFMSILSKYAMSSYRDVAYTASVEYADPHQLVSMLFRALLESLADARSNAGYGEDSLKYSSIERAQKIIFGLRSTLDFEKGGELARNLDSLYDYCIRRLIEANSGKDGAAVEEVSGLLSEISEAWHLMPNRVSPRQQ